MGDVPPDIPVYPHVEVESIKLPFPPLLKLFPGIKTGLLSKK